MPFKITQIAIQLLKIDLLILNFDQIIMNIPTELIELIVLEYDYHEWRVKMTRLNRDYQYHVSINWIYGCQCVTYGRVWHFDNDYKEISISLSMNYRTLTEGNNKYNYLIRNINRWEWTGDMLSLPKLPSNY